MDRRKHPLPSNPFLPARPTATGSTPLPPSATSQRSINRLPPPPDKATHHAYSRHPVPAFHAGTNQPGRDNRHDGQSQTQGQGKYYPYPPPTTSTGYSTIAAHPHVQHQLPVIPSFPAYSAYPTPIAQPYPSPAPVPIINLTGGYPVLGFTPPQQSFRPTATPEGYSYSETYQPLSSTLGPQGPHLKRQRKNGNGSTLSAAPALLPVPMVSPVSASAPNGLKAWRNCSHPGCRFVGSGEEVEVHEGDRHLIFSAGRKVERSEEEERFAQRQKGGPPPMIQGTGITLQSEEDIAKWIAERKSKFPTAKRVAEKEEQYRAALERGELPSRVRGLGKGKGGRSDPAAAAEEWGKPIEERQGFRFDRGRDRGRGRGRGRGKGRGRGDRDVGGNEGQWEEENNQQAQVPPKKVITYVDQKSKQQAAETSMPPPPALISMSTAPGLVGIGGYGSSASDDEEETSSSSDESTSSESDSELESSDDDIEENDSAIETRVIEIGDKRYDNEDHENKIENTKMVEEVKVDNRPLCRVFVRTGKCKHGEKCRYSHKRPHANQSPQKASKAGMNSTSSAALPGNNRPSAPPRPKQPPAKKQNPFQRPSMLGALLANPIQNTLSQLSQTIRFLVANDMLVNVELVPGQAEEEERKKKMIVEVDQTTEKSTV